MIKIILLTDYKGHFGSKHNDSPYRSGMDKDLLRKYFADNGFETHFVNFSDIDFRKNTLKDQFVLYTSSEDAGYHYKDYIEDIVLGLELQGAKVIPEYKYIRANNNKVFMEILRDQLKFKDINLIKSYHFGALEELKKNIYKFKFPVVIKSASGAMSQGVELARDKNELIKKVKKISRSKYIFEELWDLGRSYKHKGYIKESKYRKKFIVQNFIPNLKNDWKILIYGNKYFILYRGIKRGDFRASGSHIFKFNDNSLNPDGIFDFAERIYNLINVPSLSIDVCYNGADFFLTEFQALHFGTSTMEKSCQYFVKENSKWIYKVNDIDIEKVYVESIIDYIKKV